MVEFDIVGLCFWIVVSIPLLFGSAFIVLCAAEGAGTGFHLPPGRWLIAVGAGCTVGGLFLLSSMAAALAFPIRELWPLAGLIAAVAAPFLAAWIAYRASRMLGAWLCRYRCWDCCVRFRSPHPTDRCRVCTEESDLIETEKALVEFSTRFRKLPHSSVHASAGELEAVLP